MTPTPSQAIYVRLPNWVGDVCMCLPSLDALLATGVPIVACARAWAQDLLSAYPLAGFVAMQGDWRADRAAVRSWRRHAQHGRARGLLLPDSLSSALVFRLAGIPCAGYRDDGRSLMLRWPCRKPAGRPHAVWSWYHLTRTTLARWHLPVPPGDPDRSLHWRSSPAHEARAAQALDAAGLQDRPFVLIAPTVIGRHQGKVKAWQGFDELTRALQARGLAVVMAPPADEQQAAQAAAPTARRLAPLPLGAFAALTRAARIVVCNDSGVSHLSAAARAHQITLFGVTSPQRTGPWSDRARCLGSLGAWPSTASVLSACLEILAEPVVA